FSLPTKLVRGRGSPPTASLAPPAPGTEAADLPPEELVIDGKTSGTQPTHTGSSPLAGHHPRRPPRMAPPGRPAPPMRRANLPMVSPDPRTRRPVNRQLPESVAQGRR